ncbi:zinc transport system substrate-binding protein [Paenibacillus catalpae]|uniref:Zinc transport system substrate-binding protein n=1 Tax=Paenibacillus catalpae TaxID=1045775 RepID=A0A1I1V314_9BACL|nr:metal ABC transporter substrate-binding protein [Paenibacillus catalpae]SFD77442.1 zinc transport system substrate-binding protein [Paenibacillus catalpae]
MKFWLKKSIVLGAGLSLILSGCGNQAKEAVSPNVKLKVVTTFYPMYEFSKQVAGDHADVIALIPSGAEPHDWEPSAKDMATIKDADVFVYNGIVEGWVDRALSSAANEKRVVVEASKSISLMEGEEHDHEHGEEEHDGEEEEHAHEEEIHMDPHVWLDPVLAEQEVRAIQAAFEKADPASKEDYQNNADSYIAKLKELDLAFKEGLSNTKHKEFVTQHAAFGYLAKQYGLTQVPISGLSPEQEPSPDEMAEVVEFAKGHQVKTIFFETLVEPKVAQVVADEIGAATAVLNPLEGLTDNEIKNDLDYIGIMRNNLEALKKALNE